MKDEVINVEKFIQDRIEENKELFNNNEIEIINYNKRVVEKIYLLGFINSRDTYVDKFKKK